MSAPALTQDPELTVGEIGGHAVVFRGAHRDVNPTPITTGVVLRVPMSHEDVEAMFWRMLRDQGVTFADLDDDTTACWFLLDAILGAGVSGLDCYRDALAAVTPADPDYAAVARLRRRVVALIGPHPRRRWRGRPGCGEGSRGGHRAPLLISQTTNPLAGTSAPDEGRVFGDGP